MLIRAISILGAKSKDGTGPIYPGCVADVDDEVGKRYVELGVATEIAPVSPRFAREAAPTPNPSENPTEAENAQKGQKTANPEEDVNLEEMSFAKLKAMAQILGVYDGKMKSKDAVIRAIVSAQYAPPQFAPMDVIEE